MTFPYIYRWRANRPELHGKRCAVLARGKMNSAWVIFEDGTQHIISRNALRKAKD